MVGFNTLCTINNLDVLRFVKGKAISDITYVRIPGFEFALIGVCTNHARAKK